MADPIVKFFILVAGHEYTDKGLDFDVMCTHRAQEQIDTLNVAAKAKDATSLVAAPATLRFVRFRFTTGEIQVIEYELGAKGGKTVSLTQKSWKPLSSITDSTEYNPAAFVTTRVLREIKDSDYQTAAHQYPTFKSGHAQDDVMSITDVYESVQRAPDGSVVELSIFSHGFDDGPILVNSDEVSGTPAEKRDPFDKDGRAAKDFLPDMGDGSGVVNHRDHFASSFDAKGFIQVWGCNASQAPNKVVNQAYSRRRRQKDKIGKDLAAGKAIANDANIDFDFSGGGDEQTFREAHYKEDAFFPHDSSGNADPTVETFTRTFLQIRQYVARQVDGCYMYQAASKTGVKGFGALPGMEGDDERTKKYNLMQVCRKQSPNPHHLDPDKLECPNGYEPRMRFYENVNYVGIGFNSRGYGILDKVAVDNVKSVLALTP